jgi:hypothetical protein
MIEMHFMAAIFQPGHPEASVIQNAREAEIISAGKCLLHGTWADLLQPELKPHRLTKLLDTYPKVWSVRSVLALRSWLGCTIEGGKDTLRQK